MDQLRINWKVVRVIKKKCPDCKKKYSYLATARDQWICPYCVRSLTTIRAEKINKDTGDSDGYQSKQV